MKCRRAPEKGSGKTLQGLSPKGSGQHKARASERGSVRERGGRGTKAKVSTNSPPLGGGSSPHLKTRNPFPRLHYKIVFYPLCAITFDVTQKSSHPQSLCVESGISLPYFPHPPLIHLHHAVAENVNILRRMRSVQDRFTQRL